jgi:hypothetical protein
LFCFKIWFYLWQWFKAKLENSYCIIAFLLLAIVKKDSIREKKGEDSEKVDGALPLDRLTNASLITLPSPVAGLVNPSEGNK